jgi:hypothetical protein
MPSIEKLRHIRYCFRFTEPGHTPSERVFTVFLERTTHDLVQPTREGDVVPEWVKLDFAKCTNCPLDSDQYKYCPTARSLVDVIEFFADLPSFKEVNVEVQTEERTITKATTVQEGLRSLMGLIMPTSGCPKLGQLRPMTLRHTPFATMDETTHNAVTCYLLGQYFNQHFGGEASFDLSGLSEIYKDIHQINKDFLERLKAASKDDANLNGLVSLDIFTFSVPKSIEKNLNKFLTVFAPELDDSEQFDSCR